MKLLKSIRRNRNPDFISWESYQDKIRFLDTFYWQQKIRRKSALNASKESTFFN